MFEWGRTLVENWFKLPQDVGWSWQLDEQLVAMVVTFVVLWALLWYLGWQQKRRRTQAMLRAVNDAAFGRGVPRSRTGAWGFAVAIEPPPERFREFNISYQPMSIFNPLDLARRLFGGERAMFQIAGVLLDAPTVELVWLRGQPPARALGVNPGRAPWVQGQLDFGGAEYALRGTNVGAMKHVFQDMVARFTPMLVSIAIQRERRPHLRLVAKGKIDAGDVSPLITAARALGRAALL